MSDNTPKLRELCSLKINDWHKVGQCLGFEPSDLKRIQKSVDKDSKRRHHHDHEDKKECQKKMFARWIREDDPRDHKKLMQALLEAKETKAINQLQISGVPVVSVSYEPLPAIGTDDVVNMNVMLSGPDIKSKKKAHEVINRYLKDHPSIEGRLWQSKMDEVRAPLTANNWNEARLLDFIEEDVPKFRMWVIINLGVLAATNELAPLFFPDRFFHLACINVPQSDYQSLESSASHVQISESHQSIFYQALHSISSLWSQVTSSVSPKSFAAAVVGYFGNYNPSIEQTRTADNTLKVSLKNCGCSTQVVKYYSYKQGQMVYPITDTLTDYEDQLYDTIGHVARNQHHRKVVPAAIHKFLSMCWGRRGIMRLADAQELAYLCGVPKEEVRSILHHFHNESSLILYYKDIPKLDDIVICRPQLLIDAFISFVETMEQLTDYCGIVETAYIEQQQQDVKSLNSLHIKEILNYYRFLSEKVDNTSKSVCFMPFLLPEAKLNCKPDLNCFPSPFVIVFSARTVPSGVFYAFVCELFLIWQVNNEQQYKNQISFQIEGAITCTLSCHLHFIEVAVTGATESTPQVFFQYIRNTLLENLENSMAFFPHAKKCKVGIRFFCPLSLDQGSPHFAAISDEDQSFSVCENACRYSGKIIITANIAVWTMNLQNMLKFGEENTDECDETMELIKKHIQIQGGVKLRAVKCILFGPPNVGKTVTRMRLTGDIVNIQSNRPYLKSTGIDNPITVNVHHFTENRSVLISSHNKYYQWRPQNLQDQGDTFINYILSSNVDLASQRIPDDRMETQPASNVVITISDGDTSSSSPSTVTSVEENGQVTAMETDYGRTDAIPLQQDSISQCILQEGESLSFIQELVKAGRWKEIQMKLKNIEDTTLLQIIDTGGQPEFHEILSLLLPGPALYLLFINLTQKFNESFPIVYTQKGGIQSDIKYQSNFTYKEMLLQLLNTISCMNSSLDFTTRSIATLLGTHADQVTKEEIAALEEEIFNCEEFKTFLDGEFIPLDQVSRFIFPLNNFEGKLSEIQRLQFSLALIFRKHIQPKRIPTSWFLFYLALRQKYELSLAGCCTLNDATRLAAGFNIASKDVQRILNFVHSHFGTILYYPNINSLKHLVICNPNIIFKPISNLIALSFGQNLNQHQLQKIQRSGQVPLEFFDKLIPLGHHITAAMIVDLLKHHNIITEVRGPDNTLIYFMPCLLKPDPEIVSITTADIEKLDPAPLVVSFEGTGCVPLGFFPSLVVKLSYKWIFNDKSRQYRNHVTFIVDPKTCVEVSLLQYANRIEVRVCYFNENPQKLCINVLNEIHEAIDDVKDSTPYFKSSKPEYGFYCPLSLQMERPHFAVCFDLNEPQRMCCSGIEQCPDKSFELLEKHKIWFEYVTDMEVDVSPPAKQPVQRVVVALDMDYRTEVEKILMEKSKVSQDFLDVTKLNDIYRELSPHVRNDWYSFGLLLNIDLNQLDTINIEKDQLDKRLAAVINHWLKKGKATWTELVESLLCDTWCGKFNELAYRIAFKKLMPNN